MRKQAGFTLLELIVCIVILGVIGLGSATVISLGARNFFNARNVDNAGVSAQIALERISLELRNASGGPGAGGAIQVLTDPTRIIYTITSPAALAGTGRTLEFSGSAITLTPASGGTARTLLSGVSSCTMSFSGAGRASTLTVSFTMADAPTGEVFTITVKPRGNSVTPVNS